MLFRLRSIRYNDVANNLYVKQLSSTRPQYYLLTASLKRARYAGRYYTKPVSGLYARLQERRRLQSTSAAAEKDEDEFDTVLESASHSDSKWDANLVPTQKLQKSDPVERSLEGRPATQEYTADDTPQEYPPAFSLSSKHDRDRTGNFTESQVPEKRDKALPATLLSKSAIGNTNSGRCVLDDIAFIGSKTAFHGSSKYAALDVIDRGFPSRWARDFWRSHSQVSSFMTSPALDLIASKLAVRYGFELRTYQRGHPSYSCKGYNTHLAKRIGSIPPKVLDDMNVYELFEDPDVSQQFGAFIDELARAGTDKPVRLMESNTVLLRLALRGSPYALPLLKLYDELDSPLNPKATDDVNAFPRRIVMSNAQYDISIEKHVDCAENVTTVFQEVMLEYCKLIHTATLHLTTSSLQELKFPNTRLQMVAGEFLGRASSVLGHGNISFAEDLVHPVPWMGNTGFWQSRITASFGGVLSPPTLWLHRPTARWLSTMHACVTLKSLLQNAFKAGSINSFEYSEFAPYWGEIDPKSETKAKVATATKTSRHTVCIENDTISKMIALLRDLRGFESQISNLWLPAPELDLPQTQSPLENETQRPNLAQYTSVNRLPKHSGRKSLPISTSPYRQQISALIEKSDVTIIKAATGSGKTTQVPQFILDDRLKRYESNEMCKIACTQPRRISTTTVARRVAEERGQPIGQEVGYQVRYDSSAPSAPNNITYMTSGYFLRLLEQDPKGFCSSYSHIVLDEVHERDVNTDLILTLLRKVIDNSSSTKSHTPKIILMSATLEADVLKNYLESANPRVVVGFMDVPGRTFPIETRTFDQIWESLQRHYPEHTSMWKQSATNTSDESTTVSEPMTNYIKQQFAKAISSTALTRVQAATAEDGSEDECTMDDLDKVEEDFDQTYVPIPMLPLIIDHLMCNSKDGDVLVFLPGLGEIDDVERRLTEGGAPNINLRNSDAYRIFKLHSSLYETNQNAWEPVPMGCRRIILATNIAETSVTLPDVGFVVDTGLSRQMVFDQASQTSSFSTRWISKAEVSQRRGRAGRTKRGTYIVTYSQAQYQAMAPVPLPEILRTKLDGLVLRTESTKAHVVCDEWFESDEPCPGSLLAEMPTPPDPHNVDAAVQQLKRLHALTDEGYLTAMGRVLSRFPLSPAAAKSVLLGMIFRCLDPTMIASTCEDDEPIMYNPTSNGAMTRMRRELVGSTSDDRLADVKAFSDLNDAYKDGDLDRVADLQEEYSIRPYVYRRMKLTANQLYQENVQNLVYSESASAIRHVDRRMGRNEPLSSTMPALNVNSANDDLVKALCLHTVGSRLLTWQGKVWLNDKNGKVLPAARSVNHTSTTKVKLLLRMRREKGDLLAYSLLREGTDKYPWACETSTVPPLMGMLFAESLRLLGEKTLVINDWIHYDIEINEQSGMTAQRAAKVILEYRKALDRFITYAMEKVALRSQMWRSPVTGKIEPKDFNVFLREEDHPLRKLVVDSVVDVLAVNSRERKKRAEERRQQALANTEEGTQVHEWLQEFESQL